MKQQMETLIGYIFIFVGSFIGIHRRAEQNLQTYDDINELTGHTSNSPMKKQEMHCGKPIEKPTI